MKAAPIGQRMTQDALRDRLEADGVASPSVRRGALNALCGLLKESPLGVEGHPLAAEVARRGRNVEALTRLAREPQEDWALLFGLFVMAEAAGRSAFTLSSLDGSEPFVSPLEAFGMTPRALAKRCRGLEARHGAFIRCSFTHGLDEIRLLTQDKTLDDVTFLAE